MTNHSPHAAYMEDIENLESEFDYYSEREKTLKSRQILGSLAVLSSVGAVIWPFHAEGRLEMLAAVGGGVGIAMVVGNHKPRREAHSASERVEATLTQRAQ